MKEQVISFDTAKLAKEKGFEASVSNSIYNEKGELLDPIQQMDLMKNHESIQDYFKEIKSFPNAPSQSILQKWLREVHDIHVNVENNNAISNGKWSYDLHKLPVGVIYLWNENDGEIFNTYEEALEKGLFEGLKLIS